LSFGVVKRVLERWWPIIRITRDELDRRGEGEGLSRKSRGEKRIGMQ